MILRPSRGRLLFAVVLGLGAVAATASQGSLKLILNGIVASTDVRMISGRPYVPLADIAKATGHVVVKKGRDYEIVAEGGGNQVEGLEGKVNNIALGKNVTASQSSPGTPPSNAVDGKTTKTWSAGAFAPQWVQIDLGKPSTIRAIRLTIDQLPDGDTVHEIWVRGPNEPLRQVKQFAGHTDANQVLEFKPAASLTGVQYVRVITLKSPSWVGWQEIEVIAP